MKQKIKSYIAVALALVGVVVLGYGVSQTRPARLPQNNTEFAKTSAMITLVSRSAGGSGVILKSTANLSTILTNKHICQLVQVGGTVITDQGTYPVKTYRIYTKHDLCLIEVQANLHENNQLAQEAPVTYSQSTIAGHPSLLPTMITRGHFANKLTIQLMVDTEKCDGKEKGQDAFMCAFFGVKPVVISLEAQPTTALIMPGSSGSGVFNEKGEVAGLVFAGGEGLSYGLIVPFEYVKDFLTNIGKYKLQYPNPKGKQKNFFTGVFAIQNMCQGHVKECKGFKFPGIFHD